MKGCVIAEALLLICLSAADPRAQGGPSSQARPRENGPAQSDARGQLYERAKRAGGRLNEQLTIEEYSPCASLAELAARSPVIVIGEALGHRQSLSPDETRITTDTVIRVQESVRGGVSLGALITVSVPGGSHRFTDGTTVHQARSGHRPIREGARYLLFLRESPSRAIVRGEIAYEFALGPQGQFELDFEKDAVTPAPSEAAHPLVARYSALQIRPLLAELHAATPRSR